MSAPVATKHGPQEPRPDHPVDRYALRVLDGEVVANKWIKMAAQRHIDDLCDGHGRGLYFDYAEADKALAFFRYLRLYSGAFAGKPFVLFDWQEFATGSLFGWKQEDGYRRFRTAYIEGAKGCGKTPWLAGIGLKGTVADAEAGAEVYSAATDKKQARILWNDAEKMVRASPDLLKRIRPMANSLVCDEWASFFQPMSSDTSEKSGWRPHVTCIDEVHEHPNDSAIEMLAAGQKDRRQPLMVMITNSGYDQNSVCWTKRRYTLDVLEKLAVDDEWFGLVYGIDDDDDWRDETTWVKANPSYPVIPTPQFLRKQVREAVGMPSKQNLVQRLHMCRWTEQKTRWIDLDLWDGQHAQTERPRLFGKRGWLGIDLSSFDDVTALALWLPDSEPAAVPDEDAELDEPKPKRPTFGGDLLMWFFLPEEGLAERVRRTGQPFDRWAEAGWLRLTPGRVIDYDVIREVINSEIATEFKIEAIGIDPHQAHQITRQLGSDGFLVVDIPQGAMSVNASMQELQRILKVNELRHGANPILRWMAGNAVAIAEARGMLRLDKERSQHKIDGLSALVDAIAEFIAADIHSVSEVFSV